MPPSKPVSVIWREAFLHHRFLMLAGGLYFLAVCAMALAAGARISEFIIVFYIAASQLLTLLVFFGTLNAAFLAAGLVAGWKERKDFRGWLKASVGKYDAMSAGYFHSERLIYGFAGLAAILPASALCVGKSLIYWNTAYAWDPLFAEADRLLHFGRYPHEFLVPVVAKFNLAAAMNYLYLSWFLALYGFLGFALFCDSDHLRRLRFLWTFLLCFIIPGTVLATLFASVGPIYYHAFYPDLPDPYAGLVAHLKNANESTPLNVIEVSDFLYGLTTDKDVIDINAISAMPSLHVAIAGLIALYAWKIRKSLGIAFMLYFFCILAGSIYLGWHYAVDGYAGVALACILWLIAGELSKSGNLDINQCH